MAEGETNECRRTRLRRRAIALLNGTSMLAAVTAAAILLETLLFPVLQIFGTSMAPAL